MNRRPPKQAGGKTLGRDDLHIILEHATPERTTENLQMWACRGNLPACPSHLKSGKHCSGCVLADESETIEQLVERMNRGNA